MFDDEIAPVVASDTINKQKMEGMEQGSRGRTRCADYEFAKKAND